jgi:hypothetical protein
MIGKMNQPEFLVELKELRCHADWHKRYYSERSRKYHRIDYWLKSGVGLFALIGAVLVGFEETRLLGALVASGCAFCMANVLPNFKWDAIISGFDDEEQDWIRIFNGYADLIRVTEIADKGEILFHEFQKIREMQKTAALNDRHLPQDKKLLDLKEAEVREFYGLDP